VELEMQVAALMFPVVDYFKALSILAQASATLLLGASMPGNVAQPPFAMNVSCFHRSVALSSARSPWPRWRAGSYLTQIGASTDTTAFWHFAPPFRGRISEVHPPHPKPMTTVAKARDGSLHETS
jgi:hypothetical protein